MTPIDRVFIAIVTSATLLLLGAAGLLMANPEILPHGRTADLAEEWR